MKNSVGRIRVECLFRPLGIILLVVGTMFLLIQHEVLSMGIQDNGWWNTEKVTIVRMLTGSQSGSTYACLILVGAGVSFITASAFTKAQEK
jgi:hypothetical protein